MRTTRLLMLAVLIAGLAGQTPALQATEPQAYQPSALTPRERRLFDFDSEVEGMSRVEQAVALLALLELRKAGEISLSQAQSFAPIRVSRADSERITEWKTRSA